MIQCWNKVIIILVSLVKSFKSFPDIKVIVSFRTTFVYKSEELPCVYIVFDSNKSSFETFITFLKRYIPGGLTPDGLCFNATLNRIENESKNRKSYFMNLSDGLPYFKSSKNNIEYTGDFAHSHTKTEVNKIKKSGVEVLSFYVGEKNNNLENTFRKIYGRNSTFIYKLSDPNKIINSINSLFI